MKHRILTAVVVVPLLIVLTTTPAYAIFGSILAGIQRAQMIVNQGVQIYKDTMAKITFDGQLTQITEQFAHLKEQALGSVGALTDPFTDLASVPTRFIGVGLSWKNDFTGIAQGVASSVENMGETGKSFRESWSQRLTEGRHGDGERRYQSLCRLPTGDRGASFQRLSRGEGKKATSASYSITPRATLRRISWLPRKPPWSPTKGYATTPTRPTPRSPNRRLPVR